LRAPPPQTSHRSGGAGRKRTASTTQWTVKAAAVARRSAGWIPGQSRMRAVILEPNSSRPVDFGGLLRTKGWRINSSIKGRQTRPLAAISPSLS